MNKQTELTKTSCDSCGCFWLGHFYNAPICNNCRENELLHTLDVPEMAHKPITEEEINAMSEHDEYIVAHG